MGVGRGEDQGAEVGGVEPVGEFSAEDAAFGAAAAGDDLDAAGAFGVGGAEEGVQGGVGGLRGAAVEVERAKGGELAGAEAGPGGGIHAGWVGADVDRLRAGAGAGLREERRGIARGWLRGGRWGLRGRDAGQGPDLAHVGCPGVAVGSCQGAGRHG